MSGDKLITGWLVFIYILLIYLNKSINVDDGPSYSIYPQNERDIYWYLWITQRIGLFLNRFPLSLCRSQDRVLMQWKITSVTKWQNRTGNLSWKWRNSSRFYENLRRKKKTKTKKKNLKQFFFKFENKVLQKTGTLWSNHQLLIKQNKETKNRSKFTQDSLTLI